ncbi:MAG TPA: hypothetical protein VK668_03780 [Mucilaginibacter sp.]|nr:hypothetical protein [Mucilaginibacter sp.]
MERRPVPWLLGFQVAVEKRLRKVSGWLERKTAYWDRRSKLLALFLFCLVLGGLSLWLLMRAFSHF